MMQSIGLVIGTNLVYFCGQNYLLQLAWSIPHHSDALDGMGMALILLNSGIIHHSRFAHALSILRAEQSAGALATTASILEYLCDAVGRLRDLHVSAPCPKPMALLLKQCVSTDIDRDLNFIDLLAEDDRDRFTSGIDNMW